MVSGPPSKTGCYVRVESSTWARERGDLFDFEADPTSEGSKISLQEQDLMVLDSAACVRNGANVQLLSRDQVQTSAVVGSEHLVSLVRKDDSLWIHQGMEMVPGSLRPSLVVKDLPNGYHWLRGGETIRLGCARLRVRQVVTAGPALVRPNLKVDCEAPPCLANPEGEEAMEGKACRICMLEGPNEDDPLIAPCICKGSVEYVHLACLREWIRVRRNLPPAGEPSDGFEYHPLKCDLCKGPYSSAVKYAPGNCSKDGSCKECEPLAEVPLVQPPFVVLEVPGRHYGGGGRRSHVLSLVGDGDKVLKLGRAHNCHLRIPDASISRWHASIRMVDGKVVLEDHESKFGTLVEVQRPIAVDPKRAVSLQVGRTVLRLTPSEVPLPVTPTTSSPTGSTTPEFFGGDASARSRPRGDNVQEL
uniref:RING-CH-type domain-containing protein n=1 Tax=Alexandrium andersonii TaxID=327968 RepID=A0A7S2ISG3_9DINO|mmetsp:Transcript_88090/g.196958  ORF Transcript_88090/g.196958 Transcript_88090/m.196958 type:complete len:417 (+) Transcript_88090:3-1253(+)